MNLVIGKSGLIASALQERKGYRFSTRQPTCTDDFRLDLNAPHQFDYSVLDQNTKIIFLGAVSSPEACTNDYERSYRINVVGTKYFIEEALSRGARVLYFSSDVVYGNRVEVVDEESEIRPSGAYAAMKADIERTFKGNDRVKIFRLSYVLSKEDKYVRYLMKCAENRSVAEVFHPFERCVVYIGDVLEAVDKVISDWDEYQNQVFNICGEKSVSRRLIAEELGARLNHNLVYSVVAVGPEFWNSRPEHINVSSRYFSQLLRRSPTSISKALEIISKEARV